MTLSSSDLTHLIAAAVVLLLAAHLLGRLAVRLRQPKVAGEILGGLLLGPTLLGLVAPGWHQALFKDGTATQTGLGIAYQLGLLLLMYCSGTELRALLSRHDRRPVLGIALVGNVVPFLAALGFLALYDTSRFLGPAGDRVSFGLAFALAIAVTSIPVISRIMADLGILHTRFARVVLSVAVLEDLLIYVVLNFALARVAAANAEASGLLGVLGVQPSGPLGTSYYIAVTLAFFLLPVVAGPGLVQRLADWPGNLLHRASPIAFQLVFLLVLAGLAAFLGVARSSAPWSPASWPATCGAATWRPARPSPGSPPAWSCPCTSPSSACGWTWSAPSSRCSSCSCSASPASSSRPAAMSGRAWSVRAGPGPVTWPWPSTPAAAPGSSWPRWSWTPASSTTASTPCWCCSP